VLQHIDFEELTLSLSNYNFDKYCKGEVCGAMQYAMRNLTQSRTLLS
jgi:hypothetical protein